jgi:hypothetical protein
MKISSLTRQEEFERSGKINVKGRMNDANGNGQNLYKRQT